LERLFRTIEAFHDPWYRDDAANRTFLTWVPTVITVLRFNGVIDNCNLFGPQPRNFERLLVARKYLPPAASPQKAHLVGSVGGDVAGFTTSRARLVSRGTKEKRRPDSNLVHAGGYQTQQRLEKQRKSGMPQGPLGSEWARNGAGALNDNASGCRV
jgi:uncharacterized membrane protein YidH (DUF202 family)